MTVVAKGSGPRAEMSGIDARLGLQLGFGAGLGLGLGAPFV